jgi:quercetin dioxygenase-like cupin family protein
MMVFNWSGMPEEQLNPLVSRAVIHGVNMTVARITLRKSAVVPSHNHANEQITMLQSGTLRFVMEGEERVIKAGEILRIPPHATHMVEAIEDSVAVDLFSPVREDWIRGDDQYLRK